MGTNAASPKSFPDLLPRIDILKAWDLRAHCFTTKEIVLVAAVVLMVGLHLFVQYTRLGKAMRAAQNQDAVRVVGINVDQIIALTF